MKKIIYILILLYCYTAWGATECIGEKFENRCEGYKPKLVGGHFELLAFHRYRKKGKLDTNILHIKFYQPEEGLASLNLEAKKTNLKFPVYTMRPLKTEWEQGWQEFGPWPMQDFLEKENIKMKSIGVLISDKNSLYLPAIIHDGKIDNKSEAKYATYFETPFEIKSLVYSVVNEQTGKIVYTKKKGKKRAQSVFRLKFNMPADAEEGKYTLDINIKFPYNGDNRHHYSFYHIPNLN